MKGGADRRLVAPRTCGVRNPIAYIRDLLRAGRVNEVLAIIAELGPILPDQGLSFSFDIGESMRRNMFTSTLAWAVPDQASLDAIVRFTGGDRILEVGCGSGLWAGLLSGIGARVTATDPFLTHGFDQAQTFIEVERIDAATAISTHADHEVLMLIWPPFGDAFAVDTLRAFTGDRLVYIGEGGGGCTTDDDFHQELEDNWNEEEIIYIPVWASIHDSCTLYRRRVVEDVVTASVVEDVVTASENKISKFIVAMDVAQNPVPAPHLPLSHLGVQLQSGEIGKHHGGGRVSPIRNKSRPGTAVADNSHRGKAYRNDNDYSSCVLVFRY